MKNLIYVSYMIGLIGMILAGIWIAQEVSALKILDDPATGAIGFLLIAVVLNLITRRKLS